ncbi:AlpA family transcriptional regulator [Roseomonas sp. KE0001]|uniref:helix-turn-helix transcriptional regulator n=1 Tax=Roseomonas sp. KE0001 TaxID=2479201 RepID=UPI001ECAA41B|nr:helix-turn-helix domain-containing protein [Roseomonas sp. KE0001]MBI0434005.1 DNA-binding protein [Roseomonas sp. KE0001]
MRKPSETSRRWHRRRGAAEYAGCSERTLENLAIKGGGPAFAKVGRMVFYAEDELDSWLTSRLVRSTSER